MVLVVWAVAHIVLDGRNLSRWRGCTVKSLHCVLRCALFFIAVSWFGPAVAAPVAEFNPVSAPPTIAFAGQARVIVKFRQSSALLRKYALVKDAGKSQASAIMASRTQVLAVRMGLPLMVGRAIDERTHVVFADGVRSDDLALRLGQESDVEYAEVDHRRWHSALPDDPLYWRGPPLTELAGGPEVGQWYLRSPRGDIVSSINAPVAWDVTAGSASVVVAVLDSGVRDEHPELATKLLPGYDMISAVSTANDGDARDTSASDPGDWVTEAESKDTLGIFHNCKVTNSSWHGTRTSSLIGAATNNGAGMTGVAWEVKLLPVRVLGKCGGHDSDIIAGMRWAAGLPVPGVPDNPNPARVLNLSLGSAGTCSQSYIETINALANKSNPVVVIAAAGNSTGHAVGVPANCPGVIGVAGLRHIGTKVGFSDMGPEISLSAPGGNCVNIGANQPCLYPIVTAKNTGTQGPVASDYSDSFAPSLGTSFSAPLVSGTVALMLSLRPELSPAEIKHLLQKSARPFPQQLATSETPVCRAPAGADQLECHCTTSTCGAGMLDAAAAVNAVLNAYPPSSRSFEFAVGWNLAGNGGGSPIDVSRVFGDSNNVDSVWTWAAAKSRWSFFAPTLQNQPLADFLAESGFDNLTTIAAGSGFWLKAKQAFQASLPGGASVPASVVTGSVNPGWNLLSFGEATSASQFAATLGQSPNSAGNVPKRLATLWSWDSAKSKWYFYSPTLDAQGGTALQDFNRTMGYLDFNVMGKSLIPTAGFWANISAP